MNLSSKLYLLIMLPLLTAAFSTNTYGQHIWPQDADRYAGPVPGEQAIGRWDLTISLPNGGSGASWLEIEKSGSGALVGQFVGMGGSARPISEIMFDSQSQKYSFTIPPQWGKHNMHLEFSLEDEHLAGKMGPVDGEMVSWTGVRAPELHRTTSPKWGAPVHLLKNGLADWIVPDKFWVFKNGVLIHNGHGGNLITKQKFNDFRLHVEFRYGEGANSGVYLRGRYEVQVLDSYGMHTGNEMLGGIYGFLTPVINAAKKPGQWQTYDITLIGRLVTIVLNGKTIICNRPIPGITGGALDSNEGEPGPIMIQGSESGNFEYRNIIITPGIE